MSPRTVSSSKAVWLTRPQWVALGTLALVAMGSASSSAQDGRRLSYGRERAPSTQILSARAAAVIGGREGEGSSAFGDIAGVGVLGNGRIVVADARANEIRIFERSGTLVRSVGRSGRGPGEFDRILWSLHVHQDRILATDNSGRAHLFSGTGALLRTMARPALERVVQAQRVGLFSGGAIALAAFEFPPDTQGGAFEMIRVVLREQADGAGSRVARVVRTPGYRRQPRTEDAQPLLFGPLNEIAARADRVCVGYSTQYRIRCFGPSGTLLFEIERSSVAEPVAEEVRARARAAYVEGNRQAATEEMLARLHFEASRFRFANQAPAFGRFLLTDTGELWVSAFNAAERLIGPKHLRVSPVPIKWSVYDRSGAWTMDVEVPARFVPHAIQRDEVYGVSMDADGVESVSVVPLVRR